MFDSLPTYQAHLHALDPARADLRIKFEDLPADVEVRGRLMGPRCPEVSTIEVAYSLRALEPGTYQVLIPEPNLWSPECPFRYEGPVEFWHAGEIVGKMTMSFGISVGGVERILSC